MSAITGIFYRDGRNVNPELIKFMNKKLSHRGPDGSKVFTEGSVAFGHQMLHTTPESIHETLPLSDEETKLVITSDARIDNRIELSKELDIKNEINVSDSYFILKAYQEWGEKCPEKLLGDFTFAIWDQNNEKLFCARDHMGVKPLYYYLSDELFIFATEIRALFTLPEVPYRLNEQKVAVYLMDIIDNKSTFYKDIFSFSPAHSITINQNGNNIRKYWKLNPKSQIIMNSDEEYAKAFREIFSEAVKCRLRSAFTLGFELSGGLDSSSVVCMAKKILNENENSSSTNIKTFSFIYDDFPQCDESYYIKTVTDTGGIEPHFILGDKINPLENMETILGYQEQPFFTPFMVMIYKLYNKMLEKNVRIMLSGVGGDSVVSFATNYFRDLAVSFKWKKLLKELNDYTRQTKVGYYNPLFYNVFLPLIPDYLKRPINHFNNNPKYRILNKKFAKRIESEKYLNDHFLKPVRDAKTAKKNHYYLLSIDNIYMLEMFDRTTSFFSIEPRYPFLDKRLVEYCYAIPTEMKFKFGWNRYILRVAMANIIPQENQWRQKPASLVPIFERNIMLFENTRLNNIINSNNEIIEEYVDINELRNIYQKLKNKNSSYDSLYMWFAIILNLWLKESNIL